MNALTAVLQVTPGESEIALLPALIDRAVAALDNARTSADVLEARDYAKVAYLAAAAASRFANARKAHSDLIAAAHRFKADALEIEARANRRIADEYDAAQERGEVTTRADQNLLPDQKKVSAADIGLTHKDIHEARIVRDAEAADPGIVNRTIHEALASGDEPSKAKLRRVLVKAARPEKAIETPEPTPPSAGHGAVLKIPAGVTASDLCRRGIKLEAEGVSVALVAKQLNIGIDSYRKAREIVLLADRNDLDQKDSDVVLRALVMLDDTKQAARAHELVQSIAARIWGGRGSRRNSDNEARRAELFENAITVIVEACEQGAEMAIPHLAGEQISAAIKQVKQAEAGLRALRSKLEELRK